MRGEGVRVRGEGEGHEGEGHEGEGCEGEGVRAWVHTHCSLVGNFGKLYIWQIPRSNCQ